MAGDLSKRIVPRLLAAIGLARAVDVAHARNTAVRLRAAERARAHREKASAVAKISVLETKLEVARERLVAEYAERSTLRKALGHYWEELRRLDTIYGSHERRLLGQLSIGAKALQRLEVPPTSSLVTQLASVCPEYSDAVSRWRTGSLPAAIRRVPVAGVQWFVPASVNTDNRSSPQTAHSSGLPLDELATIRQFAVGGVMLDIGAGIGLTSIPRIVLGDFARAYAAEPDEETYLCLVANTLENALQGSVLPDRVAIGGSTTTTSMNSGGANSGGPCLTFEEWIARLHIPTDQIRFVRIGARRSALDILKAGLQFMTRREIVWQVDIGPSPGDTQRADLDNLCELITAHFTHFKEIGSSAGVEWRRASEAKRVFKSVQPEGGSSLLLFNLR